MGAPVAQFVKYQKKPLVVDAIQFTGDREKVEDFVGKERVHFSGLLYLDTPDGYIAIYLNDWILKMPNGDISGCRPEIFSTFYEPIEQQ